MMLIQRLLGTLLLLVLSTGVVHASPQFPTGYEAAVNVTRRLADPSSQCEAVIGELVVCFFSNCLNEPCTTQTDVEPPASVTEESCEVLEREICSSIDDSCCPPCAEVSVKYLDCIVSSSLGTLCVNATCSGYLGGDTLEGGNTTNTNMTDSNMTMSPTSAAPTAGGGGLGIPIPSTSTSAPIVTALSPPTTPTSSPPPSSPPTANTLRDNSEALASGTMYPSLTEDNDFYDYDTCGDSLGAIFTCYSENCGDKKCEANIATGEDGSVSSCDDVQGVFCSVFNEADVCCPACSDQTGAFMNCVLNNIIMPFCPAAASCNPTKGGSEYLIGDGTTNRAFGGEGEDEGSKGTEEVAGAMDYPKKTAMEMAEEAGTLLTSGGVNHRTSVALVTSTVGLLMAISCC